MDFQMPGLNGSETIEIIKKESPSPIPKMVMIIASVFEEGGNKIEHYNYDKFLLKPFKTKKMFQYLAELLNIEFKMDDLS
jgi:CheY-like chemotaxis protein